MCTLAVVVLDLTLDDKSLDFLSALEPPPAGVAGVPGIAGFSTTISSRGSPVIQYTEGYVSIEGVDDFGMHG